MCKPNRLHGIPIVLGMFAVLPLTFVLAGIGPTPAWADPWIHIKVVETGPDAETVRVNVPLSLVEAMMPLIDHAQDDDSDAAEDDRSSRRHRHHISFNDHDVTPAELRALLDAVRTAEDGEYISVDGVDEKIRVTKSEGVFVIDVDDRGEEQEQVRVRMRMEVLEALLSGSSDELNFAAAARSLRSHEGEDLVTVTSKDETVRIWIDDKKSMD